MPPAPPKPKEEDVAQTNVFVRVFWKLYHMLCVDTTYLAVFAIHLFFIEIPLNVFILKKTKYTEIDWSTYMQQIDLVRNGEYNYYNIKGDTGPLVYPAGFVYVFEVLSSLSKDGQNIRLAQMLFVCIYLSLLLPVLYFYVRTKSVAPALLCLMTFSSYRIHSIFALRLFNDGVAMVFLYAAVVLLIFKKEELCALVYSFSVSIKMNTLLFAPGFFIIWVINDGLKSAIKRVAICAIFQVIIGYRFLFCDPVAYLSQAFNFSRVFLYEWTVNWRCISESLFLSKRFHLLLLSMHVLSLLCFILLFLRKKNLSLAKVLSFSYGGGKRLSDTEMIYAIFVSNFLGIMFCRSLHYQFYVWYYHTLPFLLMSAGGLPCIPSAILLLLLEVCWNIFPSKVWSSLLLHGCHLVIAIAIFWKLYFERKPTPKLKES